jgi:putative DNA primase/helicase
MRRKKANARRGRAERANRKKTNTNTVAEKDCSSTPDASEIEARKSYDFATINAAVDCRDVARDLGLKMDGNGRCAAAWEGRNRTDSVAVLKTGWCDYGSGDNRKRSAIDLAMAVLSIDLQEAAAWLAERYNIPPDGNRHARPVEVSAAMPTPPVAAANPEPTPKKIHPTLEAATAALVWGVNKRAADHGRPEGWQDKMFYAYQREDGTEAYRVVRCENGKTKRENGKSGPDGDKIDKATRPIATTPEGWTVSKPSGKYLLYQLPELVRSPDATVFVFEGEKTADAGGGIGLLATAWPFGAGSVKGGNVDLSPLTGRRVVLVPDNDESGREAMENAARALLALDPPATVYLLELRDLLPDLPEKGDLVEFIEVRREDGGMGDREIRAEIEAKADALEPYTPEPDPDTVPAWQTASEELYGKPVKLVKVGDSGDKAVIDERAVAGGYFTKNDVLRDPATAWFYHYEAATGLWEMQPEECVRNALAEFLGDLLPRRHWQRRTAVLHRSLLAQLEGMATRPDPFAQRTADAIHVANGMLFLGPNGPELRAFAKEHYSRNRTGIAWEPGATCPRFVGELLESALLREDIELVQKYMGQCLLGRNPSQTLLVLRGTPGGGKGTFCRVIAGVVGRHNVAELRVPHLGGRFELTRMIGKTLLHGDDVPGDFLDHPSAHLIKKLVGGDGQQAEAKGSNLPVDIEGQYNIVISTNTRLRVKLDTDGGAWHRRLLLVDYELPKPERAIPDFDVVLLREEGPGILQWAVEGAQMLLADLADGGRLKRSPGQEARVVDLLTESDSIRAFVADCVARTDPPDGKALDAPEHSATTTELAVAYAEYCDSKGWEALPTAKFDRAIPDAMRDVHRAEKRQDIKRSGKNARGYYRVRLRQPEERPMTRPAKGKELQ